MSLRHCIFFRRVLAMILSVLLFGSQLEPVYVSAESDLTCNGTSCRADTHVSPCQLAVSVCEKCEQEVCICCDKCNGTTLQHEEGCERIVPTVCEKCEQEVCICCDKCNGTTLQHEEGCERIVPTVCEKCEQEVCICCDKCNGTTLQHEEGCERIVPTVCEKCEQEVCICCDKCNGTTQQHEEGCEALIKAVLSEPQPLYAFVHENWSTSISTQIYTALPVVFRTSETGDDISLTDKELFSCTGSGISLQIQDDSFWIHTGSTAVSDGTITYTAADGSVYSLTISVAEYDRLFAKDSDGNIMDLWGISSDPVSVTICYGTTISHTEIPLSKLSTGGVAKLSGSEDNYAVSSTGAGEGDIYYTLDNNVQKLDVQGSGSGQSGSLTAKNSGGDQVFWPQIAVDTTELLKLFYNGTELTSETGLSTGGVATIEYSTDDSAFKIGAIGYGQGEIYYTANGYTNSFTILGSPSSSGGGSSDGGGSDGGGSDSGTPCAGCGSTTRYHAESCTAIVPSDAKTLYAYSLDDNKTYTSISTSNNSAIPVVLGTSEDPSSAPIPLTDKDRFSFAGNGINLNVQDDKFWIQTGPYGVSNGKIVYTAEDGSVYVLAVTATESERLLAIDSDGKYMELWGISATPVSVSICYGTTTNYNKIPLSQLSAGGVAQLAGSENDYTVCATGTGDGGIYYSANGNVKKMSVFGSGNWQSGSLSAKNSSGNEIFWPQISPGTTELLELFFNGQKLTSMTGLSAGGVATIEYSADDAAFKIGASGNGQGDIFYTTNGYTFSYTIIGSSNSGPGGGPGGPGDAMTSGSVELEYKGQPVKVGLGQLYNDMVDFFFMMRDSYKVGTDHPYDFNLNLLAVAVDPDDPTKTKDVDKQFYKTISNVTLTKQENNGAGSADNLTLSGPAKSDEIVAGAEIWGFNAHADSCQGFDANVICTFDYQESKQSQPVTYTLSVWLSFVETSDLTVGELTQSEEHDENRPESIPDNCLDTAEELNFVLSSNSNLMDWVEYHYREQFAKLGPWSGITINLPAVTYNDVIADKIIPYEEPNQFGGITLIGSSSGDQRTTMPGLISGDGVLGITGIAFVAQNGKTMTFDGSEPFTCGVLMDTGSTSRSSSGWLSDCSFQGFDYGVYYTKHGLKPDLNGCLIRDCRKGLYINCTGLNEIDFPISVVSNRFVGCEKAVEVAGLPSYFSPYYLRIYHNAFLFNDIEFKIDISGTYFFKLNYYGGHHRGHGKYQGWHPGNKGDEEIRHAARLEISNKGSTKVITNPCLKAENHTGGYWLYNNHGETQNQHTAILNSETDTILVDGDAFKQNSSNSQIAILDDSLNEIAVWDFDGKEATE